ncbi:MAG TPA: type I phosphomannose isomerase catalytic subunit [Haliangium sp.]|nr:type I phosphomannose isomerase catalytic subunit [Haliangium sp.]
MLPPRPELLRPDNFTPPTRTPWGGRKILDRFKKGLDLGPAGALPIVGESWEVSVEPSFPSRLAATGAMLHDVIAATPLAWLGKREAQRYSDQTPLLVKLIDAADHLSVQVHPADDDPALDEDESGKPEGWYVLDAAPGAGLYLGFRDGVGRADVERCLRTDGPLDELMSFVRVQPGDAFAIAPGVVHAIGAGVTVIEPQLVIPGRHGLTYRYWDWNRRYDERGQPSPSGRPRPLHIERALEVTLWDVNHGSAAVDATRARPRVLEAGAVSRTLLLDWHHFALERWAGTGVLQLPPLATMLAAVCVRGAAELRTDLGSLTMQCGHSAVVPACAGAIEVACADAELLITRAD